MTAKTAREVAQEDVRVEGTKVFWRGEWVDFDSASDAKACAALARWVVLDLLNEAK